MHWNFVHWILACFKPLICNQIQIEKEIHGADVSYIDGFTTVLLFTKIYEYRKNHLQFLVSELHLILCIDF
jgi:hypothetical protein